MSCRLQLCNGRKKKKLKNKMLFLIVFYYFKKKGTGWLVDALNEVMVQTDVGITLPDKDNNIFLGAHEHNEVKTSDHPLVRVENGDGEGT